MGMDRDLVYSQNEWLMTRIELFFVDAIIKED
jgi:hypothetical protein